jgi:hypothetical protein
LRNIQPWIRPFKFEMRLPRRPAAADHFPLLIAIPSNPTALASTLTLNLSARAGNDRDVRLTSPNNCALDAKMNVVWKSRED